MSDELLEILSRLFDPSCEKNGLLDPIRRLEEVIDLETESHLTVGIVDPKVFCIKDWIVSVPGHAQTEACLETYTRWGDRA